MSILTRLLGERHKLGSPFSTPHSHPSWSKYPPGWWSVSWILFLNTFSLRSSRNVRSICTKNTLNSQTRKITIKITVTQNTVSWCATGKNFTTVLYHDIESNSIQSQYTHGDIFKLHHCLYMKCHPFKVLNELTEKEHFPLSVRDNIPPM